MLHKEGLISARSAPMPLPDRVIRQAAALPVRDGMVCLVTSRNGKRWVAPKGCMEPGMTAGHPGWYSGDADPAPARPGQPACQQVCSSRRGGEPGGQRGEPRRRGG